MELERARAIFQRFVNVHPQPKNWIKWSKFEESTGDIGNFVVCWKHFQWIYSNTTFAHILTTMHLFHPRFSLIERARAIYEQMHDTLGQDFIDQNYFVSFAKFEIRQKELERARVIFRYALDRFAQSEAENLYNSYSQFEKQYGGREGIEDVVTNKRRNKYEEVK